MREQQRDAAPEARAALGTDGADRPEAGAAFGTDGADRPEAGAAFGADEADRQEEGPVSERILTYVCGSGDENRAVRDVISSNWHLVAHDMARAKYRTEGGITVNGETVFVNFRLHEGDVVRVRLTDRDPGKIVPAPGDIHVVYEDMDMIALLKPAGLVSHPSHGHFSDTLANYLAYYFKMKAEPHEIRMVGRLDKDTSGLLLFGKSRTAASLLADQAERGIRSKRYLALVEGCPNPSEGEIDVPIEREFEGDIKRIAREGGAEARTIYRVLADYGKYSLLEVILLTGRTHQIRVHMAHIGHPLLGDSLYGRGEVNVCDLMPVHESVSASARESVSASVRESVSAPVRESVSAPVHESVPAPTHGSAFGPALGSDSALPADAPGLQVGVLGRAALHAWKIDCRQPFTGEGLHFTAPLPEDMLQFIPDMSVLEDVR